MSHSLILGQTESGKTTLAKRLAAALHSHSAVPVIVLDPMNDPEWRCGWKTTNVDDFLEVFWKSRGCHAFIDEAGDSVGRFDLAMRQTATKGRHWGHSCYYLSQRGAMLDPTVRAQCRHLFLFTSSVDDCKILAREFNQPDLMQGTSLPQGHYFHAARYMPLQRGQLWDTSANAAKPGKNVMNDSNVE